MTVKCIFDFNDSSSITTNNIILIIIVEFNHNKSDYNNQQCAYIAILIRIRTLLYKELKYLIN